MKKLQIITLVALFLISMSFTRVMAQGRDAKTRGAAAAYGYPSEFKAQKKKAKKQKKAARRKAKAPVNREKKSPWVN